MLERIKQIMVWKELNAAQFAEEIGIQRSAMSHVLSGRNNPSLDFMLKIKNRFPEINLDWLLIGLGNMTEVLKTSDFTMKTPVEKISEPELQFPDPALETEHVAEENEISQSFDHEINKENIDPPQPETNLPDRIILLFSDNTFEVLNTRKAK